MHKIAPPVRYYLHLLLLGFTVLLFNCGGGSSSSNTPVGAEQPIGVDFFKPVSVELPVASAAEVGLNQAVILSTYQMAATQPDLRSMLIVKDNQLIAEAYFNGTSSDAKLHLRSVTKTVTAMLIGIAIEQGLLVGAEQKIGEFFTEDFPNLSADKRGITIADLLTMSSGFLWDEGTYLQWEGSADPIAYLVERELSETPGSQFHYNSAAVHLLAVILDKVTHGELDSFAEENLFTPLDIVDFRWDKLRDGRVNGGAGLQLMPIDTAKLALMLLNNGRYNNNQIVPEQWVQTAKAQQVAFPNGNPFGAMNFTGYGYLWWQGT
jgi:CubicO group peptidase (beta-lactamase class C family)